MKKLLLILTLLTPAAIAAQEIVNNPHSKTPARHELVLPSHIAGYNLYKADLHTHTVFSDGQVTPQFRVREAWRDGLDILAIADHIEYRSHEQAMLDFLDGYVKEKKSKAVNTNLVERPADKSGIRTDLNLSTRIAEKFARDWGITIIPATEVTREPKGIGHYNALFTTDNNAIYDPDPMQALRNARAQGAFIQHNHPGWRRSSVKMTDFEKEVYAAGLIDGIEVANGRSFYPPIVSRCIDMNLAMTANTDVHWTTDNDFDEDVAASPARYRNMTLILSGDRSLPALKEALLAGRTIAFNGNNFSAREEYLRELFSAGFEARSTGVTAKGAATVNIVNKTSVPFELKYNGAMLHVDPFCSVKVTAKNPEEIEVEVLNMWCYENRHPKVKLPVVKL